MAAPTVPNTPLLNTYSRDEGTNIFPARLPSGRCNWVNLDLGVGAPSCPCRRFWDKSLGTPTLHSEQSDKVAFCWCGHHACFHDQYLEDRGSVPTTPREPFTATNTLQIKVPANSHLPVYDRNSQVGGPHDSDLPDTLQWSRYMNSSSGLGGLPAIPSQCLLPSDDGSRTSGSQTAYHRPFAGQGLNTLGHVAKPNLGRTLNTKDAQKPSENPKMQVYEDAYGNAFLQSLTEIATPSVRASQEPNETDLDKHVTSVHNALATIAEETSQPSSGTALRMASKGHGSSVPIKQSGSNPDKDAFTALNDGRDCQLVPHVQGILNQMADYPTKIQNHEQRLDLLENASFSNADIENLQEADEQMDTRVGELEGRVDELEKAHATHNDASSIGSRQLANVSFTSAVSNTSSALIAAAMDRVDSSRIEALEAKVAELQAIAPPSHSRPMELEVVFLPFGTDLMGIWSSQQHMTPRSKLSGTSTDDWTQTQHNAMAAAQARLTAHDRGSAWERVATAVDEEDDSWYMAKACGLRTREMQRLSSRGLVKTIQICGPDARDVQAAMMTAFEDLPALLLEDPFSQKSDHTGTIPESMQHYIGLQAAWIPLRKLHKDSCLRFLNTSEMVTPAIWTVPFLTSSVAMRHSGVRRLYVTQRDSYIQHLGEANADWTWQKLRQLPRVYPDKPSFTHTPEADAQEECWAFDPRLDRAPSQSVHSSFASHISSLSINSLPNSPSNSHDLEHDLEQVLNLSPTSPSDHFSSAAASPTTSTPRTSIAPYIHHTPSSPIKERHPFRLIHARTTSTHSTTSILAKSSPTESQHVSHNSKRRIDQEPHSAPSHPTSVPLPAARTLDFKRRRISRSPSRPRDTPRWSAGPPSPYPFVEEFADRKRGTTPFAYATPHSNAPYVENSKARSSVDVYEDSDAFEDENDAGDIDDGTDTEEFVLQEKDDGADEDFEDGYEERALSDYVAEESAQFAFQGDEEWEGVQDDESRIIAKAVAGGSLRHVYPHVQDEEEDKMSQASSTPSEYPSTQQPAEIISGLGLYSAGKRKEKRGFRIHIDEETGGT